MKTLTADLIQDLTTDTQAYRNQVLKLKELPLETLNWKADANSWSVLECMEHLNLCGDFYLSEITKRIAETAHKQNTTYFKSGWFGNYFANSMLPKEKLTKVKTFKKVNPTVIGSQLGKQTLDRFIDQQDVLLQLLEKAKTVDLTKTKTATLVGNFLKLRLGDAFRVVVYHNKRHLVQAEKVLAICEELSLV
ncbi:MAG: DinB family protein [Chitinophagales bacterium]